MAKENYHLHLKGYVGGWDFDSDYVDYIISKYKDQHINVLIDSTGGYVGTALSVAAAFRRHGDVSVHFVGLNASAATLASLGAKHISIDKAAMYLVHKCSNTFFKWASLNADQYSELIKDIEKTIEDLDKFDQNAARQYAARCKRPKEEMLALMAKGGWLTAQEALEWGFVDEITDLEEDEQALQVTEGLVEAMAANGIPLPVNIHIPEKNKNSAFQALLNLLNPFKDKINKDSQNQIEGNPSDQIANEASDEEVKADSLNPSIIMKVFTLLCGVLALESIAVSENKTSLSEDQLQLIEDALAAKDKEIEDLKKKAEDLQAKLDKSPADESNPVIEQKSQKSEMDEYFEDWNNAKKVFDALP